MRVQILEPQAAQATLRRMAFEIYEHNFDAERLTLIGLGDRGYHIAEFLCSTLQANSPLQLNLLQAKKRTPKADLSIGQKANCLIVDDVLYTGKTQYDLLCALHADTPQRVQVAVLIDRGHRSFPIRPSYVGIDLATTLQEYVEVEVAENGEISAFLK